VWGLWVASVRILEVRVSHGRRRVVSRENGRNAQQSRGSCRSEAGTGRSEAGQAVMVEGQGRVDGQHGERSLCPAWPRRTSWRKLGLGLLLDSFDGENGVQISIFYYHLMYPAMGFTFSHHHSSCLQMVLRSQIYDGFKVICQFKNVLLLPSSCQMSLVSWVGRHHPLLPVGFLPGWRLWTSLGFNSMRRGGHL
jgi:hypothetical protein